MIYRTAHNTAELENALQAFAEEEVLPYGFFMYSWDKTFPVYLFPSEEEPEELHWSDDPKAVEHLLLV